jgi:molybdenum cofactor cytidylyltransferase
MPPRAEPLRVGAVLLAAGAARRMGCNKMLATIDDEPLVRRAARRAAAATIGPLVVVVGFEAESVRAALTGIDCRVVENPAFEGPGSRSLHAGLRAIDASVDAVIVLLADMVHVTTAMIGAVAAAARHDGAAIVASRYGRVIAPPVAFPRRFFGELLEWNGEGGAKPVVLRHPADTHLLDWPAEALHDVDTAADLADARRTANSQHV